MSNSPWKKFKDVRVDEHWIKIPDVPTTSIKWPSLFGDYEVTFTLDDLVLYRKEKPGNAYWKRDHSIDQFFYDYNPDPEQGTMLFDEETRYEGGRLASLSGEDTRRLLFLFDREMFRRTFGVHFKNDEVVEWITGDHYFALQHAHMYAIDEEYAVDEFYGRYMEFQRDFAYIIYHADGDTNILGAFIAKPKKTGITQLLALFFLNRATRMRMRQMGMMSKGSDAIDVNMLYFLHGFDSLPLIFKAVVKNRADQSGEIIFGEPPVRNTRTRKGQQRLIEISKVKPLNNRVWAAKTKEAGFDSPRMYWEWFDEFPKYDTENKQDPETVFIRNQEAVKIQTRITGKIWITSYPPELDTRGFLQARKIYYDSKLSTIKNNPLGRTSSGLICITISALNSHIDAFDKHGRCDQKKAKYLNDAERNSVKHDKKLYQAKKRQYPENEKECWMSAGAGSTFDNDRLSAIEFDLLLSLQAGRSYEEGRLEWKNKLWEVGDKKARPNRQFCEVDFIPLTQEQIASGEKDRLRMRQRPGHLDQNRPLMMGRDRWGNLMPLPVFNHCGGGDPTEYALGSEVNQGSKNASITKNFRDPALDAAYGRIASGIITSVYFFRPDNPEEFYQDFVKEIIFFGKRVIIEANKAWVATRLIQDGLGYYMIVRDKKDGVMKPWAPDMEYSLIRTGGSQQTDDSDLEAIVRSIASFLVRPALGQVDYAALIWDERILTQLQDFNPKESKLYDLVMALGYTQICEEVMRYSPSSPGGGDLTRDALNAIARGFGMSQAA